MLGNNQESLENSQVLPKGYHLKGYRIERVLGVGGFGITYLAQAALGSRYFQGYSVTKDWKNAFEWFNKSAAQGYAEAYSFLGLCYERGIGTKSDKNKAIEMYRKGAQGGDSNAEAELERLGVKG